VTADLGPSLATAPATASSDPSRFRIELSLATGARVGDGQAGIGLGAFSFLEVSGWLAGFAGRMDRYAKLSGSPPDGAGALELALLGGRRFRFANCALDLVAGPAAALLGTTTVETQTATTHTIASSSGRVPRLVLGARTSFNASAMVHTFVGVDGSFGPGRMDGSPVPEGPRLPVWTVGLLLGATVGT
jgi:hypothetical protein